MLYEGVADASSRAFARAETLARALEELSGASGRAIIGDLEGVLGSFLDLIDIDAGFERAVESAAGASVSAVVVDGRRSARAALAALRREGGAGLILPVGEGEVASLTAPSGTRPLRDAVRARRDAPEHVTRVLDALFSRVFVAEDWESGIEIALANPDLTIVTSEGDRFSSMGWRIASGRAVVTRRTVEEANEAAANAERELAVRRQRRDAATNRHAAALEEYTVATSTLAKARADLGRLEAETSRLAAEGDGLAASVIALEGDLGEVTIRSARPRGALGAARAAASSRSGVAPQSCARRASRRGEARTRRATSSGRRGVDGALTT